MYNGVIETANKLKEQQKELSTKRESEDRTLSQTDLINKTNVEVAKHLIRFMHEYMTSIEVKNLPENLAKTDDISKMLKSLDDLIVSQTVTTNDLAEDLNSGIEDLIMAVEELKQVSTDKSEDAEYTEKVCEELRSVQTAITKANTAVLKGDKTKDVVSAVKALEKAVKGLEMAPVVNVAPAEVDLSGIEEKIAEIPGKIKIPETVIPENDYSALEQAVRDVQSSIDNLIFPVAEFPTTVKVTNPDGTEISAGGSSILAGYTQARLDLAGEPMYVGYENETAYIIKRINFTTGVVDYYAGSGDVGTAWAGRAGYTYVEANTLY
jgi:hypothetical protein